MVHEKTIERLVTFVHRLEDKLLSVKSIHEKLQELITVVSSTHENILDDLTNIKSLLQQVTTEQQVSPIDQIKSPEVKEKELPEQRCDSTQKENPKRSEHSARTRFSKSVSFSLEKNLLTPTFPSSSEAFKSNSSGFSSTNGRVLSHVRIHEIEPTNGEYLRLLNISNSEDYDLSGHFIQQNTSSKPLSRFRFPFNTIIQAGQTITIWCGHGKDINAQPPHVFVWKEQRKWETGPECLTILAKANGQSIAWFRNNLPVNSDQSSSDILFVHSKSHLGSFDSPNTSTSLFSRTPSRMSARHVRLSAFHSLANPKSPFTHPPSSAIHPDSHATTPIDLRAQLNQRVGLSHLYPRAKSSTFASRSPDTKDFNHIRLSQTGQKATPVQT